MKNTMKTAAMASVLAMSASLASAEGQVVVYHWFEYMPQELIEKFETETGIEIVMDTFDSNEAMLTALQTLKQSGARTAWQPRVTRNESLKSSTGLCARHLCPLEV